MAFFTTTVSVSNAYQDGMEPEAVVDKEVLLIHLSHPSVLARPASFDKGLQTGGRRLLAWSHHVLLLIGCN